MLANAPRSPQSWGARGETALHTAHQEDAELGAQGVLQLRVLVVDGLVIDLSVLRRTARRPGSKPAVVPWLTTP